VQYATFYYKRLNSLREEVKAQAESQWGRDGIQYISNILDIKHSTPTLLIGTLFKEMPKKPCILSELMNSFG